MTGPAASLKTTLNATDCETGHLDRAHLASSQIPALLTFVALTFSLSWGLAWM